MERKIASKDTIMVRRLKGNGSIMGKLGILPLLPRIQMVNPATWTMKKVKLPAMRLISSASRSVNRRFFCSLASKDRWGIRPIYNLQFENTIKLKRASVFILLMVLSAGSRGRGGGQIPLAVF